jgi:hypothetical protein
MKAHWLALAFTAVLTWSLACGGSGGDATPTPTDTPSPRTTAAGDDDSDETRDDDDSPTEEPTDTKTKEPTPRATPYIADWSDGLGRWIGDSDWRADNGVLLNDGTNCHGKILAPFSPPSADYAVEAEIQFLRWGDCSLRWGVLVRDVGEGGYSIGYCGNCIGGSGGVYISNGRHEIKQAIRSVDDQSFHKYRVEVRGYTIRMLIDDAEILTVSDTEFGSAGRVGFVSQDAQIAVRSFRVLPLE